MKSPEPFPYILRRRSRLKNVTIRISLAGEIIVSAPSTVPRSRIEEVLEKKRGWIERHMTRIRTQLERNDPLKEIPLRGELYTVVCEKGGNRGSVRSNETSRTLRVRHPSGTSTDYRKTLLRWLKNRARKELAAELPEWSARSGIPFADFSVRDQKTRWASSSGKGHLSFNWRLILLPDAVRSYLIVHELVHQVHHNHSSRYWSEVVRIYPRARECDRWLKQNDTLMSFLR
jgi:hypothetical protein